MIFFVDETGMNIKHAKEVIKYKLIDKMRKKAFIFNSIDRIFFPILNMQN